MVSFWRVDDDVKSSCTCQAGKNRLGLLDGDVTNLVSTDLDSLRKLQAMLEASDVGTAIRAFDNVIALKI